MQQNSTFNPEAEAPPRLVEIIDRLIRPSGTGGFLLSLILTAALLAAVLLTPPISLAGRLSELGYEQIGSNGAGRAQARHIHSTASYAQERSLHIRHARTRCTWRQALDAHPNRRQRR